MKSLVALAILISCAYAAHAQNGAISPNGPNGPNGMQGSNDNGRAFSNGNVPSPYEQNQNRQDSTSRSADTTYMHQQWNDGAAQNQKAADTKKRSTRSNTSTPKTGTTTNKKKK